MPGLALPALPCPSDPVLHLPVLAVLSWFLGMGLALGAWVRSCELRACGKRRKREGKIV